MDVLAALEAVLAEVRPEDRLEVVRAVNAWQAGDLVLAHTLVSGVAWSYWLSDQPPPAELHAVQDDLAARRRAARGAIGRPHDFQAPHRYGHLAG